MKNEIVSGKDKNERQRESGKDGRESEREMGK